jgi:hypothetical protein
LRAFKWSSYRGYAGLATPFDFVRPNLVLEELGVAKGRAELYYRRFVEEGLLREIESPFDAVRWQAILGRDGFMQSLRERIKDLTNNSRELPSLRALKHSSVGVEEILARVAIKHGIKREDLRRGTRVAAGARNLAMWLIWECGEKSLREIGEMFGGLDYAAVGQRVRRIRAAHNTKQTGRLLEEMLHVKT